MQKGTVRLVKKGTAKNPVRGRLVRKTPARTRTFKSRKYTA